MPLFKVTLTYENIEARGGARLQSVYTLHARNHAHAVERGIEYLGTNCDGKLFSVLTEEISVHLCPTPSTCARRTPSAPIPLRLGTCRSGLPTRLTF